MFGRAAEATVRFHICEQETLSAPKQTPIEEREFEGAYPHLCPDFQARATDAFQPVLI
ncbi:hypothetical protein ATCR1_21200 [Agrobacterium tumefaciens CCNWGS0286]|nr:hypothetical protein ATCR1_21200 [Agrobacterium tumefaciens CCNWGS0286]